MTVIFTNLKLNETVNRISKFIKNNRIFRYASCLALAFISAVLTVIASGVTVGYTVKYSDEVIAVVSSQADYNEADAIVVDKLDKKTAQKASINPKFGLTLTVKDRLSTTEEIIDAIVNNNDDLIEATAVFVNGKLAFCSDSKKTNALLTARLNAYLLEGASSTAEFTDSVKAEKGYFLKADMVDAETAQAIIDSFGVKTVSVLTHRVEVPFETKNISNPDKPHGYSAVTVQGENGITEKTEQIVTLNGEAVESTLLESKVIKDQVSRVVSVGTGDNYISATTKANVVSAGFICPISAGRYKISAYYGDGRNHKGIDLAADRGTPIFAAGAGKVVTAGWDGDYGYSVIIEHANGMKTRYAHANALCVKTGDTVAQGDMIATVGSTGWSTGNHLHFEVIVNGVRVNPGPYIGLR